MPTTKSATNPPAPNRKRKSTLLSPSRSNTTPKKEDNKQLKLDTFFSKQKVRKVEDLPNTKVINKPITLYDSGDESEESPVPLKISENVIVMDEMYSDSLSGSGTSIEPVITSEKRDDIEPLNNIESYPVDSEAILDMSQSSNKLSPVNNEDSMDLFNDDCYAQFCKPSTDSKAFDFIFDELNGLDFETEKRRIEEDRREMQETLRINKINRDLNEKIRQYEEEAEKRALETIQQTSSKKDQMDILKKMMDEDGITDMDVSILADSQESSNDFQKLFLYNTLSEEIQRFYIFDIGKVLIRTFKSEELSLDSVSQKLEQQSGLFSVENYNLISQLVSHKLTIEQPEAPTFLFKKFDSLEMFQEVFEKFGVNFTKQNNRFEVICPEELVHIYNVLQTNSKSLSMLIKKLIQFQSKSPSNSISVFLISLFICMNRCVPQSMIKFMQGNIFRPQTISISKELKEIFDSTLSKYLFHSSILSNFNNCMKLSLNTSNTNTIAEMLLEKFGFNDNVPSLDLNHVTLPLLLQTTKHFFPPCFSHFIQSKSWLHMTLCVRELFKKMFLVILVQFTQYQPLSKDQILSNEDIPQSEHLFPLLKHSILFMKKLADQCPIGNNANYVCLHIFETILSILQIIFDKPMPKGMTEFEQQVRQECSAFSQSLSDILPVENYRFFTSLLMVPFIDDLFPSKLYISGSGIVQKTLTSLIKK